MTSPTGNLADLPQAQTSGADRARHGPVRLQPSLPRRSPGFGHVAGVLDESNEAAVVGALVPGHVDRAPWPKGACSGAGHAVESGRVNRRELAIDRRDAVTRSTVTYRAYDSVGQVRFTFSRSLTVP